MLYEYLIPLYPSSFCILYCAIQCTAMPRSITSWYDTSTTQFCFFYMKYLNNILSSELFTQHAKSIFSTSFSMKYFLNPPYKVSYPFYMTTLNPTVCFYYLDWPEIISIIFFFFGYQELNSGLMLAKKMLCHWGKSLIPLIIQLRIYFLWYRYTVRKYTYW